MVEQNMIAIRQLKKMELKLFKDTKDLLQKDGDEEESKMWRGMTVIAKGLEMKIKTHGAASLFLTDQQKEKLQKHQFTFEYVPTKQIMRKLIIRATQASSTVTPIDPAK